MDREAGWWTTSGNIGLPPLARAMGVGRQQQPSGPAAEVGESSCIASIVFFSDHTISVKYKSVVLDMDGCMEKKKRG